MGCVSIGVDIWILLWFPCGNGFELLTLKKKGNIPIFVVYGISGKHTTIADQAIKDNVNANSVIIFLDYTQRKYHNVKSVADHAIASRITNAAISLLADF